MKITHKILIAAAVAAIVCFCLPVTAKDAAEAPPAIEDLDEQELIDIVKSDASYTDKLKACRGLRIRGTVKSVPALADMLTDPKLSHIARYALEPMPYPAAGKALRDAVAGATGKQKAGLAASLGYRRDKKAVRVLAPLLNDADAEVAQAAAAALGRIATPGAVKKLFACKADGAEGIEPAVAEALLAAAGRLNADGKIEAAADIYAKLSTKNWPTYICTGAFYGLAEAKPEDRPELLLKAIGGDDLLFREIAASLVGETSGAEDTKTYADALPSLSPEAQVALLRGLMMREDPVARPAVVKAVENSDPAVQAAAVKALSVLGTADDVPMLAARLDGSDAGLADAANYALTVMQGEGADAAMAAAVGPALAPVRAKLLELLANRRAEQALPLAMASLSHDDAQVRMAALRALPPLAGSEQAPGLLQALYNAKDGAERTAAERVLVAVAGREGETLLPVVLDALDKAGVESSVSLLHVVARVGGDKALKTVLASLNSKKEPISDEAVRVLSDWPTFDAAPHLLELAKSEALNRHVLGLRGYVRLAGNAPSGKEKIEMLKKATALAKRPEEKRVVLGAWGALPATQSLEALKPALDDAEVRQEAAAAILAVADKLAKNPKAKPAAAKALELVVQKAQDENMKNRAKDLLGRMR